MRRPLILLGIAPLCLGSFACHQVSTASNHSSAIIGAWVVKARGAPFPYHMFVFHSDGTMQQANPDAGDPNTSDSNGMGVWVSAGGNIEGKLVEVTADRATHQFVSRGEISFVIKLNGNAFSGTANGIFYDAAGQRTRGPVSATM